MSSPLRKPSLLFAVSILLLTAAEILRVYWIMPFPGSQRGETLATAYALHRYIWLVRVVCGLLAAGSFFILLRRGRWLARAVAISAVLVFAFLAYQTNGPMSADVMFRQPTELKFAAAGDTTVAPETVVLGVALESAGKSEARAYPVQLIGHHHQVRDVVAGRPILISYCTVCRTGRVFDPVVEGKAEDFRLVGMDNWNAMFEDASTGSWWRQATGEAVAGPRKGAFLGEIESRQMTWKAWLAQHPESTVMLPDPGFAKEYAWLDGYAEGKRGGKLTGRNPESWQDKSWVVGVLAGGKARAFDWNELAAKKALPDNIGEAPVLLLLGPDGASFYAYDARLPGLAAPLDLEPTAEPGIFLDKSSGSRVGENGVALDGPAAGARLNALPAYQEFWHSWKTFHPGTTARREAGPAI
jgi:hypothetical protein